MVRVLLVGSTTSLPTAHFPQFTGIGEFSIHKEFVVAKLSQESTKIRSRAEGLRIIPYSYLARCAGIPRMKRMSVISRREMLMVLAGTLLAPRCFGGKVQVWADKGIDFSQFKTYRWLPPKILTKSGVEENDPEFGPLIKDAINHELTRKGLREVSEGGDLEVSTLALAQSIPQLEGFIFMGTTPDFFTAPVATVGRYNREGTLIINLIDAKTQKSAWCGMAKESVDRNYGSGKKKIAPAAAKLFKKFPKLAAST